MRAALVLVDLQYDFLREAWLEPASERVIEAAARLLDGCRRRGVPVIHVWTTVRRDGPDRRMPHWRRDGTWKCVAATSGHQPPSQLAPRDSERVVHKTFFSAFSSDDMVAAVSASGADTLLLAGVHLHACVRGTAVEAHQRGLRVLVAEDAVGSHDPPGATASRAWMEGRIAEFLSVTEVLGLLDGGEVERNSGSAIAAAARARAALASWRRRGIAERAALLTALAERLEASGMAERMARDMAREIGKPVVEGRGEVLGAAALLRYVVRRAALPEEPGVRRRPLGVVALVTPWNNPLFIPLGKIAPALLYGNCVAWKPHELATQSARQVLRLLSEMGCPDGVVTLIEGDAAVARELMACEAIDAITITGSSAAGYAAQHAASRRRLPLQAELGGNNAAIVWSDCDLEAAAQRVSEGAFVQAGQRCTANRRAVVAADCYDRFIELLSKAAARLPWGDPLDEETRVGPLVSVAQRGRVAAAVAEAAARGARVLRLVDEGPNGEAYFSPTLVCCDDSADAIVQHETFGPVLVVQRAADWEQALALCNGVRQGLAAALFTTSRERADDFLERAEAGILKINQSTAGADPKLPFGGWKASGLGPAEHGSSDREFYSRVQAVYDLSLEG